MRLNPSTRIFSRGLILAMLTLLAGTSISILSILPSNADVRMGGHWGPPVGEEFRGIANVIVIFNTISKADALWLTQHAPELEKHDLEVDLNSTGGDVDAALQIGQIIRRLEASVLVSQKDKCYSSCALIYIAGISRFNRGVIGLHRPYFAAASLSRQQIEQQAPLMLRNINEYVKSMGVTDLFYQEMVNTEPSNVRLYRGEDIEKLVPKYNPTYDEIETSYEARRYGIDTAEMRQRKKDAEKCEPLYAVGRG